MRKVIVPLAACCWVTVFVAGCSSSNSPELTKAKAELDAANAKAAQAQAAIESANANTEQAKTELAKARSDIEEAQSKLKKAQDDLASKENWLSQVEKQIAKSNKMRTERGKAVFEKTKVEMAKTGATFDGEWRSSASSDGLHVKSITISKNDFPCEGMVALQLGQGSIMALDVTWQQMDGVVVGLFGEGITEEIAWIDWSEAGLSGKVSCPFEIGNQPRDLSFSELKKK